jgi:hypothetical protein
MRRAASVIAFLVLLHCAFGQLVSSQKEVATKELNVELRTNPNRVRLSDEMLVTVFFRSPDKIVTMWNAFGWTGSTGLSLQVLDHSGREVKRFTQMYDILPPDETGQGELISIGGDSFAGFDSHVSVKALFPRPGTFILKCIYDPPLPRNYFQGSTIWGKEDGQIESSGVSVIVDK